MQLLDTLRITQQFVPARSTWVIKNQVIYPAGKVLGFDFFGNFLEVYDQFNLAPRFEKKFFNNVLACADYMDKNNKSCHVNLMEEYWALDNLQKFATFCETHGINYSHSPIIYDYKIRDFPLLNKHKAQN